MPADSRQFGPWVRSGGSSLSAQPDHAKASRSLKRHGAECPVVLLWWRGARHAKKRKHLLSNRLVSNLLGMPKSIPIGFATRSRQGFALYLRNRTCLKAMPALLLTGSVLPIRDTISLDFLERLK